MWPIINSASFQHLTKLNHWFSCLVQASGVIFNSLCVVELYKKHKKPLTPRSNLATTATLKSLAINVLAMVYFTANAAGYFCTEEVYSGATRWEELLESWTTTPLSHIIYLFMFFNVISALYSVAHPSLYIMFTPKLKRTRRFVVPLPSSAMLQTNRACNSTIGR